MVRLYEPLPPDSRANLTLAARRDKWLREFWFETSRLCGSQPYVETIEALAENVGFADAWMGLALEFSSSQEGPVGAQNFRVDPARGTFRASTSSVAVPPTYFKREFVPVDPRAWEAVERLRAEGEPRVTFTHRLHWSRS